MDAVLWRYAPRDSAHQGAFIFGVPARDLTQADLDEFEVNEADLAASPLYERVMPEAPAPVWQPTAPVEPEGLDDAHQEA